MLRYLAFFRLFAPPLRHRTTWLAWLVLGLLATSAHAMPELGLQIAQGKIDLNAAFEFLQDDTARLDLDGARAAAASQRFKANHARVTNFGFTKAAYWLHVRLKNKDADPREWLLENQYPQIDYYDLYLVYPDNRTRVLHGGDRLPFSARDLKHRHIIHRIPMAAGEGVEVYIRVASQGPLRVPLVLWSANSLLEKEHQEQLLLDLFYGILMAMFLYNGLLFVTLRDPGYGYYLLYLGSFIVYQLVVQGLAFEFFWPNSPNWGNLAMPAFLCSTFIGVFQFTRAFLQLVRHARRLEYVCQAFCALYALLLLAAFIFPYGVVIRIIAAVDLLALAVVFAIGLFCFSQRVRQAKYFVLAWSALLIGGILETMATINFIPGGLITNNALQIGAAIEVVLLSFALADRMQILKAENERIMQHATEMLEENVRVRTIKLEQANRELADALTSLKTMQNDMIRVEKMAALGSLVGGIAHELNTPIGNSIMMGSTLLAEMQQMLEDAQKGLWPPQNAVQQLHFMGDGATVLMRNLERAAELVSSFKQVAVDRASNQVRRFDVKHTLEEVVLTLEPMFRATPYRLELDLAPDLIMESYPGALGQIITNFVSNSILHGFAGRTHGCMRLTSRKLDQQRMEICFSDDGVGIAPEHLTRVFEPFFTTRLGQGSSGLGMHIVYNLVTDMLCGDIRIDSQVGGGTRLVLVLPCVVPG